MFYTVVVNIISLDTDQAFFGYVNRHYFVQVLRSSEKGFRGWPLPRSKEGAEPMTSAVSLSLTHDQPGRQNANPVVRLSHSR